MHQLGHLVVSGNVFGECLLLKVFESGNVELFDAVENSTTEFLESGDTDYCSLELKEWQPSCLLKGGSHPAVFDDNVPL